MPKNIQLALSGSLESGLKHLYLLAHVTLFGSVTVHDKSQNALFPENELLLSVTFKADCGGRFEVSPTRIPKGMTAMESYVSN